MLTPLCQVGAWSQSSKSLKVVDEMRLVEISAGEREVCPSGGLSSFDPPQHLLKAEHAAERFGRESDGFLEQGDESLRTQAKLRCHLRDGALLVSDLERGQRERDSRMRCLLTGQARQEEAFEDAHPFVVCLGRLQLFAQVKGGCSEDAGKINDLVGQLGGRQRQKRAHTARLEADVQGRDQSGRIKDAELGMGTAQHAAMKALELIGLLWVRDPKPLMSQINHQGYPTIRKATLFRLERCLSFREVESLNRGRKGRRREKAVDRQDDPPIDAGSSRYLCTMAVPTCEERTTSRESVREIFGRKHVHVLVYHVTDGAEAQELFGPGAGAVLSPSGDCGTQRINHSVFGMVLGMNRRGR
jgi:hypothetical protein